MEREGNVRSGLLLGRRGGVPAARRRHRRPASATRAGTLENPTYEDVCSHTTGHAEVVEVTYDPERISYDDLLQVFWDKHDPTQLNRQGWDIGDQYRSAIFFHDEEQQETADRARRRSERQARYKRPVVTQIEPAQTVLRGRGLPPAVPREARPLELHARAAHGSRLEQLVDPHELRSTLPQAGDHEPEPIGRDRRPGVEQDDPGPDSGDELVDRAAVVPVARVLVPAHVPVARAPRSRPGPADRPSRSRTGSGTRASGRPRSSR